MPILPLISTLGPVIIRMVTAKAKLPDDVTTTMIDAINKLEDKDISPAEHAEATALMMAHLKQSDTQQITLNRLDAVSQRFWQAGWRPFIGWVCGLAFCWHFLVSPIALIFAAMAGITITTPSFDMETLNTTLFGLLGLGVMRSYEKINIAGRQSKVKE